MTIRHAKTWWNGNVDRDSTPVNKVLYDENVDIPLPNGGDSSNSSSNGADNSSASIPLPDNPSIWDRMQNFDSKLNNGVENFVKSHAITNFLARAGQSGANMMTGGQAIPDNYDTGSWLANGVADLAGVAGGMVTRLPEIGTGAVFNTGNALNKAIGQPAEEALTKAANRFGIPDKLANLASNTNSKVGKYALNNLTDYAIKGLTSGTELGAYNGVTNYVNGKDVKQGIEEGMGQGMLLGAGFKVAGDTFSHFVPGIGKAKVLGEEGNNVIIQDKKGNKTPMNKTIFNNTAQKIPQQTIDNINSSNDLKGYSPQELLSTKKFNNDLIGAREYGASNNADSLGFNPEDANSVISNEIKNRLGAKGGTKYTVKNTAHEKAIQDYEDAMNTIGNYFGTNKLTSDEIARIKPELGIDIEKLLSNIDNAKTDVANIGDRQRLRQVANVDNTVFHPSSDGFGVPQDTKYPNQKMPSLINPKKATKGVNGEGNTNIPLEKTTPQKGSKVAYSKIEYPSDTSVNIPVPQQGNTQGTKNRQFIDNSVKNSNVATDEMKNTIQSQPYEPITNKSTWEKAQGKVEADPQSSLNEFISNSDLKSADDTALGEALINKAIQEGRIEDANSLSVNLAEKLTRAGQTVQAAAIFKRLSPEGMLQYANKVIQNANTKLPPKKQTKLPDDVAKKIVKDMQDISKMPEGQAKTEATQVVLKNIADQIPAGLLKKIDTLQTMAQLLNPKTSVRNILGNAGMQLNENLSNVVGTPIDMVTTGIRKLVGSKDAQRTVGLPNLITQGKGYVQGLKNGTRQVNLGITGDSTQFDLPNGQVFNNKGIGKVLNGGQKILDYMLRVPDEATKTAIRNDSLRTQMKLAKVDTPTEEMKQIAENDAKYGTFQDDTHLAKMFSGFKKSLNFGKDFGLGSLVLKYPKTPANIIMRAVDYSPAGFFKSVYRLAEPLINGNEFNQRDFVKATSRALVGTGNLIGTGYILGKLGIITGKSDTKTSDINKSVGLGDYKLNVSALKRFVGNGFDASKATLQKGDNLINYDWFQPASIGLAIGANATKKVTGGDLLSTIADAIDSGATTLMQQPLVTGITQFASQRDPIKAVENALQGVPSSMTPTILKQVAQLMDNTTRSTYDPNWKNQAVNMVKSKIPGQTQSLLPNLNIWGNTQKAYENNSVGNIFLNPAFNTTYLPTPQAEKALSLYNKTSNSGVIPKVPGKSITVDGQPVNLTPEQYLQLQTLTGQGATSAYNNILNNTDSNKLAKDTSTALSNNTHDSQIKVLQDNNLPLPLSVDKENLSQDLYKKTSDEAKQIRAKIKEINDSDMTTEEKKKALEDLRNSAQSAAQKNPPKRKTKN